MKVLKNLKNPNFKCKGWYIAFLPLTLLGFKKKAIVKSFALKHWEKFPKIMHRLYWVVSN